MEDIYRSIEALMILHNLCIDHGDTPEYRRARPDAEDVPQDDPDSEENMDDDEEGLNHDEEGGALQAGAQDPKTAIMIPPPKETEQKGEQDNHV
ncbi:hypothetical protein FRC12_024366 [Ceratobasidium sp. 428]|nr:hypothetical protein FRC12_024366 [Ceratobasidium sp. 428]